MNIRRTAERRPWQFAVCLALTVALLGSACSTSSDTNETSLVGPIWQLISDSSTDLTDVIIPESDKVYSLNFLEGSAVNAQSDCNNCSGTYAVTNDSRLTLGLGCTEAACVPTRYPGVRFATVVSAADSFTISDGFLRIFATYQGNVRVLLFEPAPE